MPKIPPTTDGKEAKAMRKVLGVLLVFCLLAATPLLLPACAEEELEGQLPTHQAGDQWVWSYTEDETTYTLTEEITGEETVEGRDCYVTEMVFDPLLSWTSDDVVVTVTSNTYWSDKDTIFYGLKMESQSTVDGEAYTYVETYSYDPWTSLFPLEIGKEVETEITATLYLNDSQLGDPTLTTEKYKVDSKEDVTVTAGTFSCWKIIMYDGEDNVTETAWYSDEVKSAVKVADADGNTLMELQSYSVS
jgi:hypothetical protein